MRTTPLVLTLALVGCAAPGPPRFALRDGGDSGVGSVVVLDLERDGDIDVLVALPESVQLVESAPGGEDEPPDTWGVTWSGPAEGAVLDHPVGALPVPAMGGLRIRLVGETWLLTTWNALGKDEVGDELFPPSGSPRMLLAVGHEGIAVRIFPPTTDPAAALLQAQSATAD